MSDARNRVVREARRFWGLEEHRRVDWDAVERGVFARIEDEHRADRQSLEARKGRGWKAMATALAAAAALAALGRMQKPRPLDADRATPDDEGGGIVAIEGPGDAMVDGHPASVGMTLRLGDVIETHGVEVTLGRPGKLIFVVERDSSATVTHVRGALVVALVGGAIEAQVVPVAQGEAFAVDVGRSRIAVHGTHLRVARTSERVVVDLNDGVVSVGEAPRVGPTLGALVTAPAHAEFTDSDAQGTLRVTHDPSSVRPPAQLSPTAVKTTPAGEGPATNASPAVTKVGTATVLAGPQHAEPHPPANALVSNLPVPVVPPADPNAHAVIAGAVHACMAERLHAEDVTIVVSTTLNLELRDDGSVRSARFDPPVAPDVNACVAKSIYKTRFTHGGAGDDSRLVQELSAPPRERPLAADRVSSVMAWVSRAPMSPNWTPIPTWDRVQRTTEGSANGVLCPGMRT